MWGTHFLSTYYVPGPNGSVREYRLSAGTVVVTALDAAVMKGTVSIQFGGYVDLTPGSETQPQTVPTSLSISGTLTAAHMAQ